MKSANTKLETHPDLGAIFKQSLKRTASARDMTLLRSKGWRL
jgi:hypothetical protein